MYWTTEWTKVVSNKMAGCFQFALVSGSIEYSLINPRKMSFGVKPFVPGTAGPTISDMIKCRIVSIKLEQFFQDKKLYFVHHEQQVSHTQVIYVRLHL